MNGRTTNPAVNDRADGTSRRSSTARSQDRRPPHLQVYVSTKSLASRVIPTPPVTLDRHAGGHGNATAAAKIPTAEGKQAPAALLDGPPVSNHKYALERMTGELLPVLDSLEKAVESAAAAKDAGAIGEGVELSLKMFLTVLRKVGIEQLDPLGEPFDPQFHEALAMVENPDSEPNSVMEVIQRGYSLNGRLVRAAKVVVVKAAGGDEETDANTDA